jgi:hypothetical protein
VDAHAELDLLRKELAILKYEEKDKDLNPHKYFDLYEWQDEFIYQKPHIAKYGHYPSNLFLTNANQTGKSFSLQVLAHRLCTDQKFRLWHWGDNQPRVIWYVLPTQDHINDAFDDNWEAGLLSRGEAKKEGLFAWKVLKKGKDIKGIQFLATGCKLMFITLAARGSSHQGRSVGAILFDEEPDVAKIGEFLARGASFNCPTTGRSLMIVCYAFTPTSAQDWFKKIFCYQDEHFLSKIPLDLKAKYFWNKQLEEYRTCTKLQEKEELMKNSPTTWKRRVSMFEANRFMSGKQGRYTEDRVREFIAVQPSKKDIMVRVFASFEKEDNGGNIYKYFNKEQHTAWMAKMPHDMKTTGGIRTAGLDYGSGSNHPGGVVITWISPDFKKIRVIKMWRGEKGKVTTAEDIVQKYLEMSAGMNIDFPFYDWSCADLNTIYWRMTGKELQKAQKNHEIGVGLVDTLFKNNMLQFWGYSDEPYLDWVATDYEGISHSVAKKDREDTLSDCIRYSLAGVAHLFDLKDIVPVRAEQLVHDIIKTKKTPEDYGVRTWANVPEEKNEDKWEKDSIEEWGEYFGQ